jgi:nuclear transcription factor Y alpha
MRRPRGPGGRFLTAEEVAAMDREKRGAENGGDGGENEPVKEIEKPNNATRTPNNKGPQQRMGAGNGNPPSSGSLKRKAGQAGMGTGSPLKKTKAGNGRQVPVRLNSESEEDSLED